MQIMKKILIISLGLVAVLSAGTCLDQNKFYSIGYIKASKKMEEPDISKAYLETYTRLLCKESCRKIAAGKSSDPWDEKKYLTCDDMCMQGVLDVYDGAKPKMKLCEEEKK